MADVGSTTDDSNNVDLALDCQLAYAQEVRLFEWLVSLSIGFALISFTASAWCCYAKLLAHPRRAAQLYGVAATFKILQGILLLTVFAPTCPTKCVCAKYHLSYVYPLIVLLLGNMLAYRSKQFYDAAQKQQQQQQQQQPGLPTASTSTTSPTIMSTNSTKKANELV